MMDDKTKAIAKVVAPKFFEQGHGKVYVARCCERVLVSPVEAKKCQTCDEVPEGQWVTREELEQ